MNETYVLAIPNGCMLRQTMSGTYTLVIHQMQAILFASESEAQRYLVTNKHRIAKGLYRLELAELAPLKIEQPIYA